MEGLAGGGEGKGRRRMRMRKKIRKDHSGGVHKKEERKEYTKTWKRGTKEEPSIARLITRLPAVKSQSLRRPIQ